MTYRWSRRSRISRLAVCAGWSLLILGIMSSDVYV